MRNEDALERIRVRSIEELDAVVGKFLTAEKPRVQWEDAHTQLQFDSVEEAIEAARDPFFRQFVQTEAPRTTVVTEVREYRRYSSDIRDAWLLVERLTERGVSLFLRQEDGRWLAHFGDQEPVSSLSGPVAICLAALRMCGVEIEGDIDRFVAAADQAD
jgi:hypothetical protein